jgi:hypothetical protein
MLHLFLELKEVVVRLNGIGVGGFVEPAHLVEDGMRDLVDRRNQ